MHIGLTGKIQNSLLGMLSRKSKSSKKGGLEGLLQDSANAKVFAQVAGQISGNHDRASAAILSISDRFESSAALDRAGSMNASNNASRSRVADAAMQNASDVVGRLGELSARASDPTLNAGDRQALNAEAQQLRDELSSIQSNSRFNGQSILQGGSTTTFTGEGGGNITTSDADLTATATSIAGIDLTTQVGAQAALVSVANASTNLISERVRSGANTNRFERAFELSTSSANEKQNAAANIQTNELGVIGSQFGSQLAPMVNELLGLNF